MIGKQYIWIMVPNIPIDVGSYVYFPGLAINNKNKDRAIARVKWIEEKRGRQYLVVVDHTNQHTKIPLHRQKKIPIYECIHVSRRKVNIFNKWWYKLIFKKRLLK